MQLTFNSPTSSNRELKCTCDLYHLKKILNDDNTDRLILPFIRGDRTLWSRINFQSWQCHTYDIISYQMSGSFFSISDNAFLCEVEEYSYQESSCKHYVRPAHTSTTLVDCSHMKWNVVPRDLTNSTNIEKVSLAYSHLTSLPDCHKDSGYYWMKFVDMLDMTGNDLSTLEPEAFDVFLRSCLKKNVTLILDDSRIKYLPENIQYIEFNKLSIMGNPLQCDCHTSWMVKWLKRSSDTVSGSRDLKCINKGELIHVIISMQPVGDL